MEKERPGPALGTFKGLAEEKRATEENEKKLQLRQGDNKESGTGEIRRRRRGSGVSICIKCC